MATRCTSKGLMSLFQEPVAAPLPVVLPFSRAGTCVLVPVLLLRPPAGAQVLLGCLGRAGWQERKRCNT